MSFSETLKREFRVAFSKHAQPIWFRLVKYAVLGTTLFFFWKYLLFWIFFIIFLVLGFLLHFWYRHKTNGWTKSYGAWDYEKNRPFVDP